MKILKILTKGIGLLLVILLFLTACKQSMVMRRVDYSHAIESVLTPDDSGKVTDSRHGLSFNIKPLQYIETKDTSSVTTEQVRYIRDKDGFYYITAPEFKKVYVMLPEKGKLKLSKEIMVVSNGISKPAFNQRGEYIQLINRTTGDSWQLNGEGLLKKSQMQKDSSNK